MDMLAKLPDMPDDALNNLRANAVRLEQTGSAAQRASASALLPAIEAELSARQAAKRERMAQTRRAATARKRPAARQSA